VKQIVVAGGVSANKALRDAILNQNKFKVHIPPLKYCTDNAVMIAAAGYYRYLSGQVDTLDMDVLPTWPISRLSANV
jgi:N6-L-threonylcarbamoyladenine synthase